MAELEEAIDSLNFPVMIKPINSHEFVPIFGTKLFIIDSPSELRDKFQQTLDANQPIVISEIIPGSDYKTLERVHMYVNSQGDVAVAFCNLKLRQTPPMYGVMRVGRSTAPNAEVLELATKLLQAIDYRGFASVEFKRDHRDNLLKLMEVNIRMPRSLPLPIASGVDFPYLIYRDLVHDDQIIIKEYNPETYLIEITADLADFIRYDKNRNLRQFVQPYLARHKTFSYLDFSDPMPFLNQTFGRSTRFILKKLGLRRK
jgi:predicted ATP-grasp superfamily ATP-dependent carboligase